MTASEQDEGQSGGVATATPMTRRLSFNKRPLGTLPRRRTSQMSGISNYPPQTIEPVEDEDYAQMHQRYRGVSFCGGDVDYDERIRVPRMSLSSMFHSNTSGASGGSSGTSASSGKKGSALALQSLGEETGAAPTHTFDYRPASYDLSRGLRNFDSSPRVSEGISPKGSPRVSPRQSPWATPRNTPRNTPRGTPRRGSLLGSFGGGGLTGPVGPAGTAGPAGPVGPPRQINAGFKCDYTPPVLRPTEGPVLGPGSIAAGSSSTMLSMVMGPLGPRELEPLRAHWKTDMERPQCAGCQTRFTLFLRRHHCRHCGDIFCGECVGYTAALNVLAKFQKPQGGLEARACRVCRGCYGRYQQFLESGAEYEGQGKPTQGLVEEGVTGTSVPSDWAWSSF